MSEQDALFWMKFSHEWSGGLRTSLAFLMLFAIATRTVQKRAPANLAMVRTSKVATWALLSGGAFCMDSDALPLRRRRKPYKFVSVQRQESHSGAEHVRRRPRRVASQH